MPEIGNAARGLGCLVLLCLAGCVALGYPGAQLPKEEVAVLRCAPPLIGVARIDDFEVMKNDGRYGEGAGRQSRGVQVLPGTHDFRFCWYFEEGGYAHWRRFTAPFEIEAGQVYVARVTPERKEQSPMGRLMLGPKLNRDRFTATLLNKKTKEKQVFCVGDEGQGEVEMRNEKWEMRNGKWEMKNGK